MEFCNVACLAADRCSFLCVGLSSFGLKLWVQGDARCHSSHSMFALCLIHYMGGCQNCGSLFGYPSY